MGGPHIVQTLRTFPQNATAAFSLVPWHYDFAPNGEFGLRKAYLKAIGNARDFIYIEDQYMISAEVSSAIAAAMKRSTHLVVILTTAPAPDSPKKFINDAFDFHQTAFINQLLAVDKSRVGLYDLANVANPRTAIYCHAKICVIDDIWAIIGSCNMSQRSFTNDAEISIAILDETIEHNRRKFARDLRIALWKEHLGLTPAEVPLIDDAVIGAAEWSKRAGKPPAHAREHHRPAGSESSLWNSEIDPLGPHD